MFVCYYYIGRKIKLRRDEICQEKQKDPTAINKKKRKAILKFIEKEMGGNGYAPSVREIGKAVGRKSTATVHNYLAKLAEKRLY